MSSLNKNEKKKNPDNIIIKNLLKYNKTKEEQSQNIIKKLIFHKRSISFYINIYRIFNLG